MLWPSVTLFSLDIRSSFQPSDSSTWFHVAGGRHLSQDNRFSRNQWEPAILPSQERSWRRETSGIVRTDKVRWTGRAWSDIALSTPSQYSPTKLLRRSLRAIIACLLAIHGQKRIVCMPPQLETYQWWWQMQVSVSADEWCLIRGRKHFSATTVSWFYNSQFSGSTVSYHQIPANLSSSQWFSVRCKS